MLWKGGAGGPLQNARRCVQATVGGVAAVLPADLGVFLDPDQGNADAGALVPGQPGLHQIAAVVGAGHVVAAQFLMVLGQQTAQGIGLAALGGLRVGQVNLAKA